MEHSAEMRRCLESIDVEGIRKLWQHVSPHLSQHYTDHEALACIHLTRTQSKWLSLQKRAYSHRWLTDNGYPSALPDELKPSAERLYPKIVEGVGVGSLVRAPHTLIVRKEMTDAVEDCYAEKRTEPTFVRGQLLEARAKELKKLFGRWGPPKSVVPAA